MKIARIPIIASPFGFSEIAAVFFTGACARISESFRQRLAEFLQSPRVYLTGSGTAALFVILKALRKTSAASEVVLPAYTAATLVTAVQRAGLKVVLCDVNRDDFSMEAASLKGAVSEKTLAVVGVHLFGVPMKELDAVRQELPAGICFIADCAQSMGAKVQGKPVGLFSDVSFYSFNRGKNFPLYNGGAIAVRDERIAQAVAGAYEEHLSCALPLASLILGLKTAVFTLVSHPALYGCLYPLIRRRGYRLERGFPVAPLTGFQCALGMRLLDRAESLIRLRQEHGRYLMQGLADVGGVGLPQSAQGAEPAYNRFPVVFREEGVRARLQKRLQHAGIDCLPLYQRPLHHIYELGYAHEAFPNACFTASHLVTLPVHEGVSRQHLDSMIDAIRKEAS